MRTSSNMTIEKTREAFKLQISLNHPVGIYALLIYNKERDKIIELRGDKAKFIIGNHRLNRLTKPKTYVYGRFFKDTKQIKLEYRGEIPKIAWPNW